MTNNIERPRCCGECARMQRFRGVIASVNYDGVNYDGGCPEFGIHVKNTDVCRPNVGVKHERKEKTESEAEK